MGPDVGTGVPPPCEVRRGLRDPCDGTAVGAVGPALGELYTSKATFGLHFHSRLPGHTAPFQSRRRDHRLLLFVGIRCWIEFAGLTEYK